MKISRIQALSIFSYYTSKTIGTVHDLVLTEQRGDGELWAEATTLAGTEVVVLPPTGGWRIEATSLEETGPKPSVVVDGRRYLLDPEPLEEPASNDDELLN